MGGNTLLAFRMLGFNIKVDSSWLFIAALITWSLGTRLFPSMLPHLSQINHWILGAMGAAGFFVSILLHEMGHSVVARNYGIPIRGITLFIFGGVAELGHNPQTPKQEFMVAAAGPLVSFLLGLLFFGLGGMTQSAGLSLQLTAVFRYLFYINIVLALFNLVPAFPLDGGRIFRAALWKGFKDYGKATRWAAKTGMFFAYALMAWGVWDIFLGNYISGMWSFFIAMFLHNAAKSIAAHYPKK